MPLNKCRVCANLFFPEPLLRYKNMPKSAQCLPSANTLKKDNGVDFDVWQCSGCGLVQLSSKPVSYYREVIRAAGFSEEMKNFREAQFVSLINKFSLKAKKIIEIGCGRGEYLSILRQLGVKAYGLEYSKNAVRQCVKSGLRVSRGFIQNSSDKLKYAPFDAFMLLNFLEHLPDPIAALRGIYSNLADDAIGLVEVPNFDMILRNKLFSEFIPDHLLYFTKETLTITLRLNGLNVISCNKVWHDYILSAVVKKDKRLDLSNFYERERKLKLDVEKYIRRFKDKKIAIWGAGHQALAMISLMNLSGKVKYVIDSASFKQNKFTPATHIPIVSPSMLDSDPVDAVIIMAASYSDEVARIMRKKFNKNIKIAIMRDFGLETV